MNEKIYMLIGGKKKLARKVVCKVCSKEILVRHSLPHRGLCNKCWPKINKGGHGDIESLERKKEKSEPFLKKCIKCGEEKWLKRKPKKEKICVKCVARGMNWKENGRKHPRAGTRKPRSYINARKKNKRFETKKRLIIKFGNKCAHCEQKNLPWAVYQFHHVGEKTDGISIMMDKSKWEDIEKEAEKCIMLCSNCHVIAHHGDARIE